MTAVLTPTPLLPVTLDWPSLRFMWPATQRWGLSLPRSGWRSFFTGQRQFIGHAAERVRLTIELPPCGRDDAPAREAFLLYLARTGSWVRLPNFARPTPVGTMRGAPTVSTFAAAGATSIVIEGATAGRNMLRMSQSLGRSPWTRSGQFTENATQPPLLAQESPPGSGLYDTDLSAPFTVEELRKTSSSQFSDQWTKAPASVPYFEDFRAHTFSIYLRAGTISQPVMMTLGDGGIPWVSQSKAVTSSWKRHSVTGELPFIFGATPGQLTGVLCELNPIETGTGGSFETYYAWGAQLEQGSVATPYVGLPSLLPGDVIGVGDQLMQVAPGGSTINADTEVMTVPLIVPLRKALSPGQLVKWDKPTGLFQLDTEEFAVEYSSSRVQDGITLTFTEVF